MRDVEVGQPALITKVVSVLGILGVAAMIADGASVIDGSGPGISSHETQSRREPLLEFYGERIVDGIDRPFDLLDLAQFGPWPARDDRSRTGQGIVQSPIRWSLRP